MGVGEVFASLNLALIALVIGAIALGARYLTSTKKKDMRKLLGGIAIAGLLIFGAGALIPGTVLTNPIGPIGLEKAFAAAPGVTTSVTPSEVSKTKVGGTCPPGSVEDVTVTLSAVDKYTTTATGGTHRYRINGGVAETVSDGGTFTASGGDTIEILWENGSAGSNYFSKVDQVTLPCDKGTVRLSTELVQNGTLTIEVFNEEGNLIDTSGENETIGAGDVVTLTAKLKGTFQRGFPYGGVLVVEYNATAYDDVIAEFGGSKTNVPDFYTVSNTANIAKAYTVPAILSNEILEGKITIDADDTHNPSDVDDITLKFYPSNYYINEDTGGSFDGPAVEDEDDNQVYPLHVTSYTLSVD